jgi:hypothetical protein
MLASHSWRCGTTEDKDDAFTPKHGDAEIGGDGSRLAWRANSIDCSCAEGTGTKQLLRQNITLLVVYVELWTTPMLHIYILLHCATNR